jgi:microcystin-dependent protein
MTQPFLAEIRAFAFSYVPYGWLPCDGRIIPIQQNAALFSLIGTYYGGNGTTNFGLPNLQGSVLVGQGSGTGLTPWVIGEVQGSTQVTLTTAEMPMHTHQADGKIDSTGNANMHMTPVTGDQISRYAPATGLGTAWVAPPNTAPVQMYPMMVGAAGGNLPHENMQPYLSVIYGIATASSPRATKRGGRRTHAGTRAGGATLPRPFALQLNPA